MEQEALHSLNSGSLCIVSLRFLSCTIWGQMIHEEQKSVISQFDWKTFDLTAASGRLLDISNLMRHHFFLNILISFFFTVPPLLLEGYTGDRLLNAPEYLKYLVPVYKIKWKTGTRLVISDLGGTNNSFWGKFDQKSLFPLSQSNVQSPFLKREFRFMCQTGQYHLITTSRWSRPCPEPSAGAAVMKVYLLIMDRLAVTLSSSYWLVVIVQEWIYLIDLLWFLCFISP